MKFREERFKIDGGVINYVSSEAMPGAPMIWLHGLCGRWQRWRDHLEYFAAHARQIAPDARGHGKSSRVPGKYRWLDHAEDANACVRQVVKERVVLIGHSLGAMEAIKVAADQPEKIAALILEDPPLYSAENPNPDFTVFKRLERIVSAGMTADQISEALRSEVWILEGGRREFAESLSQLDVDNLRMTIERDAARDYPTDEYLSRIQSPTLIMRASGPGSALSESEHARALSKLRLGSGVTIANSGHMIHAQHPIKYRQVIENFLRA